MKTLLREPLVHFLVAGLALFGIARIAGDPGAPDMRHVVISAQTIDGLAAEWERTWGRRPTPDELDGLVAARVREEILYREALALGLDRDDPIVRRRLGEKVASVFEDLSAPAEPTDAELAAHLAAHAARFRIEARYTFRHAFLGADRGPTLEADAARLLGRLRAAGATAGAEDGDAFPLGHAFEALPAGDVARIFGDEFASFLDGLEVGAWHGPVRSSHGVHLVRLTNRVAGRAPALDEVREAVVRDWREARRREANDGFYRDLSERYTVTIEPRAEPAP